MIQELFFQGKSSLILLINTAISHRLPWHQSGSTTQDEAPSSFACSLATVILELPSNFQSRSATSSSQIFFTIGLKLPSPSLRHQTSHITSIGILLVARACIKSEDTPLIASICGLSDGYRGLTSCHPHLMAGQTGSTPLLSL